MVRKAKNKELLKRLQKLQGIANKKSTQPIVIDLADWLECSDELDEKFVKYCDELTKNKACTVLIDTMILQTDMYLDLECICILSRGEIKEFANLAKSSEIEFLKKYISAFENLYVVKGSSKNVLIMQQSLLKQSSKFVQDFFEHYKILSVEELAKRYKDVSFLN